jgi:hypothetical protein
MRRVSGTLPIRGDSLAIRPRNARAIWTENDFCAYRGKLHGPDGIEDDLVAQLGKVADVHLP